MSKLEEFKNQLRRFLQRRKFEKLLKNKATPESKAGQYLKSRNFDLKSKLPECYDFSGDFEYKGKVFRIPDSIVFPLRNADGVLSGIWLRFLEEKRFYIWMVDDLQKFWVDIKDTNEPVYLAESIFDALSLRQIFNVKNVAASLGISAAPDLIEELKDFDVVMCLDNDSAGIKGMLSMLKNNKTQHWKVLDFEKSFENCKNYVEIAQQKDYNDIIKFLTYEEISPVVKSSIQAKVFLSSKM